MFCVFGSCSVPGSKQGAKRCWAEEKKNISRTSTLQFNSYVLFILVLRRKTQKSFPLQRLRRALYLQAFHPGQLLCHCIDYHTRGEMLNNAAEM